MRNSLRLLTLVAGVPFVAAAQTPVTPTPPTPDTAVHRFHVDASALKPGEVTYRTVVYRDTAVVSTSNRSIAISETNYAGTPAWLIADRRDAGPIVVADSVIAAKADLKPMHWASTIDRARLVVEFAGDSIYGVAAAPTGRRSIVAAAPPGAIVNSAMLETLLRLMPLQGGWQDSTTALSLTVGSSQALLTRLAVTGEETIQVPAGTFDCWLVTVSSDAAQALYWVSKKDPVVVRSAQPGANGTRVVTELVSGR